MMPARSLARAAAGAALALLVAVPALLAADAPITLKRTLKKGDIVLLQSDATGNVAGTDFTVTATAKNEVQEVKENGDVVAVLTGETSKVVAGGAEVPSNPTPPHTVTRDSQGRLKGVEGELGDNQVFSREATLTRIELDEPILSDKPVVVGQTWETERDNPLVNGKKFLLKTTLEAVEKDGDKMLWKIKQTAEIETTGDLLKSETTFWLDSTNGQFVKLEANLTNFPTQLGAMSISEKRSVRK